MKTFLLPLNLIYAHSTGPEVPNPPQEVTKGTGLWDQDKSNDLVNIRFQFDASSSFSDNFKTNIRSAFAYFEAETCLRNQFFITPKVLRLSPNTCMEIILNILKIS